MIQLVMNETKKIKYKNHIRRNEFQCKFSQINIESYSKICYSTAYKSLVSSYTYANVAGEHNTTGALGFCYFNSIYFLYC